MEEKNISGNFPKSLVIFLIILGFITTFASGYFLSALLASEKNPKLKNLQVLPTPQIIGPTNQQVAQTTTKFLPGKHYFDDTVVIVSKTKPQKNLVASVTRAEQDKNYSQTTRVSFYDGNKWIREINSSETPDSTIVSNNLVKNWTIDLDPSRVLKESVQGEIIINNRDLSFSTGILQNEIGMRSLPGYTKFMSQGSGTLKIDGQDIPVYILYTRIYSSNSADIQYYDQSLGLTTDWVAFWDKEGRFYHVDSTDVAKPIPNYQTHQIGVMEDLNGSVTKTFNLSITRDQKNPPVNYTISIANPINASLKISRINGLNKAPNGSYTWFMGNIEGSVQTNNGSAIEGVGLLEYIHD